VPTIRALVAGAYGRMGREVVRVVTSQPDLMLVAAVDPAGADQDAGAAAGIGPLGIPIRSQLSEALADSSPDVLVDFTVPSAVMGNLRAGLAARVACVVGTTGISQANLEELDGLCRKYEVACLVAPNFAIGAVLVMQFAARAARFFPAAEIIELHHEQKLDAPSGTALRTAETISAAAGEQWAEAAGAAPAARGLAAGRVRIHSVRLPGLVAHQEVIFGGPGQTLSLRHDSISRESFMPGVLLAIRKVRSLPGLVCGLERLLDLSL